MNRKFTYFLAKSAFLLFLLNAMPAYAVVDTVHYDSASGDWVFTLNSSETNEQKIWRYAPRNQFKPFIKDSFRWVGKDQFFYSYDLKNDAQSKQAISYLWVTQARMQVKGWPVKLEKYHEGLNYAEWSDRFDLDFKNRYDIIQSFIRKPSGWRGRVSMTDSTGIGHDFGWFSGADNDWAKFTPLSLYPGKTLQGAGLFRPELPGVGLLGMKGDTEERGRPGDFPANGPLAEKMDELETTEEITIPVLVPAVSIPVPYNGAELAKSVQKEISYWVKFGYAKQDVIDRLNRQFDVLIPALQSSNKDTARAAAYEMYKEIFSHHHRLSHHQFDYDHDEHESKPFYYKRKNGAHSQPSHEPPLHRVAARALGTNLMYLMTRLEIGR